jgi:hypothetical protein
MPIFLRRFYIKKINETIEEQNKAQKDANKKSSKGTDRPGITPGRK